MAVFAVDTTGNDYIDGILSPQAWDETELTFSFPSAASNYGVLYGSGEPDSGFSEFSDTQKTAVRAMLAIFAQIIPITFTEITETDETHAFLRFANSSVPNPASSYEPQTAQVGGDVWIDPNQFSLGTPTVGAYTWYTYLHEIGHALGLNHAHDSGDTVPTDQNAVEYTIMSYGSYPGGGFGAFTISANNYPTRPMTLDIQALHYLYGSVAAGSSDLTYHFNPTTGVISRNTVAIITPAANKILTTLPPERTSGSITWDLSDYTTDCDIDMRPGMGSVFSNTQLCTMGTGVTASANVYVPTMYGAETDAMPTRLILGTGDDTIVGNSKTNTIVLGGNRSAWTFAGSDPYTLSHSTNGLKTFTGIEQFTFDDGTIQLWNLTGSRLVAVNITAA